MADRNSYLARIVRVLQSDTVDGVMVRWIFSKTCWSFTTA